MINPGTLVDAMVERLRTIPEVREAFPDETDIVAYHHDFAEHTQWLRVVLAGKPGMAIRWAGTSPGGGRPFVHAYEIAVKLHQSLDGGNHANIYSVILGFVNGKPGGLGGCCDRNWLTPLSNDVLPMYPPSIRPLTDSQGQDYWMIYYSIPEKGDTC